MKRIYEDYMQHAFKSMGHRDLTGREWFVSRRNDRCYVARDEVSGVITVLDGSGKPHKFDEVKKMYDFVTTTRLADRWTEGGQRR